MGISQADLSRETGIPSALITRYYNGKSVPGLEKADKIAKVLGLTLSLLTSSYLNDEDYKLTLLKTDKGKKQYNFEGDFSGDAIAEIIAEDQFTDYNEYTYYLVDSLTSALQENRKLKLENSKLKSVLSNKVHSLIIKYYNKLKPDKKQIVDSILFNPEQLAQDLTFEETIDNESGESK